MPFTFAHPAIVIPLKYPSKPKFFITSLIMGSMIPDFEYFIRMKIESIYSHTWLGLFWFDLPVGLLTIFIYQKLIKNVLITHLPATLNRRFSKFIGVNKNYSSLKNILATVICIIIGSVSHLLWDGFTHPTGYFVKTISALSNMISIGNYHVYLYKLLQHVSTLIGILTILFAVWRLPQGKQTKVDQIIDYWLRTGIVIMIILIARLFTGLNYHQYGNMIVTIISGGLLGLIISSAVERRRMIIQR